MQGCYAYILIILINVNPSKLAISRQRLEIQIATYNWRINYLHYERSGHRSRRWEWLKESLLLRNHGRVSLTKCHLLVWTFICKYPALLWHLFVWSKFESPSHEFLDLKNLSWHAWVRVLFAPRTAGWLFSGPVYQQHVELVMTLTEQWTAKRRRKARTNVDETQLAFK
jgi:hypothetical protein